MPPGQIRRDGVAVIKVNSPSNASVISAIIRNYNITAKSITPNVLKPGLNDIVLRFDNVEQLMKGNTYIIDLMIYDNNGLSTISSHAVYQ